MKLILAFEISGQPKQLHITDGRRFQRAGMFAAHLTDGSRVSYFGPELSEHVQLFVQGDPGYVDNIAQVSLPDTEIVVVSGDKGQDYVLRAPDYTATCRNGHVEQSFTNARGAVIGNGGTRHTNGPRT